MIQKDLYTYLSYTFIYYFEVLLGGELLCISRQARERDAEREKRGWTQGAFREKFVIFMLFVLPHFSPYGILSAVSAANTLSLKIIHTKFAVNIVVAKIGFSWKYDSLKDLIIGN